MNTNWIETSERDDVLIFDKDLSYVTSHKHICHKGDYARAMYYQREDTEEKFAFRCKTPLKLMLFLFDREYYRECTGKDHPEEREFLWVRCGIRIGGRDPILCKKMLYSGKIALKNSGREFGHFNTFYRVGEYITCPVKHTVGCDSVAVRIGPSACIPVYDNDLINEIHGENQHGEYIFRIVRNEHAKKCTDNIVLKYIPLPEKSGNVKSYVRAGYTVFPGIPLVVIVSSTVVDDLNTPQNQYIRQQMQENFEFLSTDLPSCPDYIDVSEISSFCKHQYKKAYQEGRILVRQRKDGIYGSFSLGFKDENGTSVSCEFTLGNKEVDAIIITRICISSPELK